MNTSLILSVDQSCDDVLQWTKRQLKQAGLRHVLTFDLHTVRHTQHDCPCPNHGTADCDCQMVVLMVYGESAEPATLILHGSDGQTRFSITEDPSQQADRRLVASIKEALDIKSAVSV